MSDSIDAAEVLDGADLLDEVNYPGDLFAALFSAAGIEGDGDLVLCRVGDRVTVAGRLEDGRFWSGELYRIVEPS